VATLRDVFEELNKLKVDGIFEDYAVGGGMALLFYTEPVFTYDVDVFIHLPAASGLIISMAPLYRELTERGFTPDAEHVRIHGTPVQFLVAYNPLVEEAMLAAIEHDYEGVRVKVLGPEHLAAINTQTGGAKRRERVAMLIESEAINRSKLTDICRRHGLAMPNWNTESIDGS